MAQQATANVNGVVKDPSGAAIANAQVDLTNVNTGVVRKTTTNSNGIYTFPERRAGYRTACRHTASGFTTVSQPAGNPPSWPDCDVRFSTESWRNDQHRYGDCRRACVGDFNLGAGHGCLAAANERPAFERPQLTQLLTILPGVANLNTDQNSGGGGGWNGASVGQFSFPAVNGARNRSNMFILDGANDLNTLSGTYNYAPIVDAIQEFKSQGHNDLAEYGGAAGAMVSVVTKSGTNQYHGALWEFLRNEVMDSRGLLQCKACLLCGRTSMALRSAVHFRFQSCITARTAPSSSQPGKATGTLRSRKPERWDQRLRCAPVISAPWA